MEEMGFCLGDSVGNEATDAATDGCSDDDVMVVRVGSRLGGCVRGKPQVPGRVECEARNPCLYDIDDL